MANKKFLIIYILLTAFIIITFSGVYVDGQISTPSEVQQKLAEVSGEEKEILGQLFAIIQEIEAMERQEEEVMLDIEVLNEDIAQIEEVIEEEMKLYEEKQEKLKTIVKSYQRGGTVSYLKIILESDSISSLIRRINTIRHINYSMEQFLSRLEQSKDKLLAEKATLDKKLRSVEQKQQQVQLAIDSNLKSKEEIEEILLSMGEKRDYYQNYLNIIHKTWDGMKPALLETMKQFANIIQNTKMPKESLKRTITLSGIKGAIDEKVFNDVIKNSSFAGATFNFHTDRVEMVLKEKNLVLIGEFQIIDEHILKFQAKEGTFYGWPLETSAVEDLFKEQPMALSLKKLVGNNKIKSVQVEEGYIELLVKPVLFQNPPSLPNT